MTEPELRAVLAQVPAVIGDTESAWLAADHEYGPAPDGDADLHRNTHVIQALAAAVERVLDLCDGWQREAENEMAIRNPYPAPDAYRLRQHAIAVRAALYGTTPGTTQETP